MDKQFSGRKTYVVDYLRKNVAKLLSKQGNTN